MRTHLSGFTMCPDEIVEKHGLTVAAVFGKIRRYESMSDGVCRASQTRMAEELSISPRSFGDHLATLVAEGYVEEVQAKVGGRTNHYRTTGKLSLHMGVGDTQNLRNSSAESADVFRKNFVPDTQNLPTKIVVKDTQHHHQDAVGLLFKEWEGVMGAITVSHANALNTWLDDWEQHLAALPENHPDKKRVPAEIMREAIETMSKHADKPNLAYLEAIMKNWMKSGVGAAKPGTPKVSRAGKALPAGISAEEIQKARSERGKA